MTASETQRVQRIEAALSSLTVLPERKAAIPLLATTAVLIGRRPKEVNPALFKPRGRTAVDEHLGDLARSIKRVKKSVDDLSPGAISALADLGLMRFDLIEAVVASQYNLQRLIDNVRQAQDSLPPMENPRGGNEFRPQATVLARHVAQAYERLTGEQAPRSRENSAGSRNLDADEHHTEAAYGRLMKEVFSILTPDGSKAYKHPALEAAKWLEFRRRKGLKLRELKRSRARLKTILKTRRVTGRFKFGKKR